MECDSRRHLKVETDKAIYEIDFGQIQIEITGRCNMRCRHCRAGDEDWRDLPVAQIVKVLRFARRFSGDHKEVVVSGGEPLLHREFADVLKALRDNGCSSLTLTTNGYRLTREHLRLMRNLDFRRVSLSVSLDSLDSADFNAFRGHPQAYDRATDALRLIAAEKWPGMFLSMRTTLRPHQLDEMERLAAFAHEVGANRISFSGIHPVGRAASDPSLWMSRDEKRRFLERVAALQTGFAPPFVVSTNDPLKCLLRDPADAKDGRTDDLVFNGCIAAAATFNVNVNGDLTPCALLDVPIMNVLDLTVEQMIERYSDSAIVRDMLELKLTGKCGACALKQRCGGCRARALGRNGHFLAEDPDCWL